MHETNACNITLTFIRILYEEGHWVIYDGDGKRASTNGTWLYLEDCYELIHGDIVKVMDIWFKVILDKN